MKLTRGTGLIKAKLTELCLVWLAWSWICNAQGLTTTTVAGTVYLANGQPGSGTLQLSWPAFTTANDQAVAAGRTFVTVGADGFVSVNLAPNQGATPAGLYYTAVYNLSDGTTSTEYWLVPAAAQAALAQVRAQLMPAAQAVQTVSKSYVDQSVEELTQSLLTASGGSLSGPLFLNGDPSTPTQAATKHYVDTEFSRALPMNGGAASGPLTGMQLGAAYQVDQFTGSDFGVKLQACLSGLNAVYGGTCDARNFTGNLSMGSSVIVKAANATVQLPCATIATSNQIIVTAGTRNVTLHGCALRGASTASGSQGGTVILYSGAAAAIQVGDPTYAADTSGFHIDNVLINTTASTSSAGQGMAAYRTQEMNLSSLYFLGNSNQTGITLDGTGNYVGGTFEDLELGGYLTAINGIGHQMANAAITDWVNASTFVRLHIDCPTNGGSPSSGTYGINLQQGDGNTFTGGDVEGCATALHLGANAQNNTIVGLRNENSTYQIVADAGSSYNNWITGGTMFTGQLVDNGTRNSFLDTFHRSFNGLNGDWYGSQQDATVTNHYRIGIGSGNERGLLNRYQTDTGYRWTTGLSDATAGEQFYQVLDELNNVYRLSIGQYNNGQPSSNNQTVINAAGTGAVVLNGSSNAGTGGVVFGSGGSSGGTVATINNAGNAQFNGTLQVGGASTFINSTTVKNGADAEADAFLWAGATANQKESFIYKDYTGASQWYLVKDASNNWALNSATGGLDSFKAYQSTNSGDTYINASNPSGVVRINYETGSGAGFNVYGGNSSSLYAGFTGATSIKFPGLAAGSGHNCVQIDNSGYLSNTGASCGSINSGITGQIAMYGAAGTTISGMSSVPLSAGGTGATTAGAALGNLGAQAALGFTPLNKSGDVATGPMTFQQTTSSPNGVINAMAPPYNATCNLTQFTGSISASSAVLTGTGFTSSLVGQSVIVWGAGGMQANGSIGPLVTTVASYQSSSQVTLAAAATTALSSGALEVGTLDTAAIQTAYNAAAASNASLLFPANFGHRCLTGPIDLSAGSILNSPISIEGQGSSVSSLAGLPGQDVLYWPDGRKINANYAHVKGLHIWVDSSLDVSSSPGGAGTYPNRVTGEAADGNGGLTAVAPPIAPGPSMFTGGSILQSGDSTYDELTVSTGNFNTLPVWMVVGQPVVIPSLGIHATITSVISATQVTFSPAYSAVASNLSGTYLSGLIPPWHVGNCGIAIPASSGTYSGGFQMMFEDLWFTPPSVTTQVFANHTCGMFFQQAPYRSRFTRITMQNLFYGYIEALPTSNNQITWTPDTSTYHDFDTNVMVPVVMYAGNHRIIDGMNIYGANHTLGLGPFMLNGPLNSAGTSTVTHFYHECWSNNTGENQRWSGWQWTITNASLTQCNGPYVAWTANGSVLTDVQIGGPNLPSPSTAGLQLSGSENVFLSSSMESGGVTEPGGSGGSSQVNDSGLDNYVDNADNGRRYAENFARFPTGINNGSYLNGNSETPYVSLMDLHTDCNDWRISAHSPASGGCVQDTSAATDGNFSGKYFYTTYSGGSGYYQFLYYGTPMAVGYRLPQGTVYLHLYGSTASAQAQIFRVYDTNGTVLLATCSFAMTSAMAWHGGPSDVDTCAVNLSTVALGDALYIQFSAPATGASETIQWIDWIPYHADPISASGVNVAASIGLQIAGAQIRTTNLADFSAAGATVGQVPQWNGTQYAPTTPSADPTLGSWTDAGVAAAGAIAVAPNATRLWSIELEVNVSATKITYRVSTADNSANLYDIGIYSATGTLVCHTGATAGATFAPSAQMVTLPFLAACILTPGRYIIGLTGNAATAILYGTGNRMLGISNGAPAAGGTTTGGVLNSSMTPPTDAWAGTNGDPQIALHN